MKMPLLSKAIAAMIAIAGLTVCPPSYADDWDDPGDDPGAMSMVFMPLLTLGAGFDILHNSKAR